MKAKGAAADFDRRDQSRVYTDERGHSGGNYQPTTATSRLSTSHTDESGRQQAAELANDYRRDDRKIAKAALARKKLDQKWGAPEGID